MDIFKFVLITIILLITFNITGDTVKVINQDGKWQLMKNDQPFFIKGAGGDSHLDELSNAGGNCIRTWGIGENFDELLDLAYNLDLDVVAGLWLGHERHGFDYNNREALEEQKENIRKDILRYKDHPAILIWAIGNEMEGFENGDNPLIWNHVQDIAKMVKELDPNHPTMTVTAEIGGKRVQMVHDICKDIDIMGINSYGGLASVPQRYRNSGGKKPYIITEFGPPGTWETAETSYGAPLEMTSTQKAEFYKTSYLKGCIEETELCLGAFAFHWGAKLEGTSTWYGMFLSSGEKLGAVDVMTELWSGKKPDNLCPEISEFKLQGDYNHEDESGIMIEFSVKDPDKDDLSLSWAVFEESPEYLIGEQTQWTPLKLSFSEKYHDTDKVIFNITRKGDYRIFLTVKDAKGGAATANIPVRIDGEDGPPYYKLPVAVYCDDLPLPWFPSGWMGSTEGLTVDLEHKIEAHSGENCIKIKYKNFGNWTGVSWQHPANDWGELAGGYDLTGAKQLTFWAKGEFGGETVSFGLGLLNNDREFYDTAFKEIKDVTLKNKWKKYSFKLSGSDLSRIKTPFYFTTMGDRTSTTFYLDDIKFE